MPLTWDELEQLKRSYNLLGVPVSATGMAIKQAYHRMAKRWHPDLYANGSRAQAEAGEIMKQVNEAYARIQHAPLRYHVESYPRVKETRARAQASYRTARVSAERPFRDDLPVTDRMEYWVRFTCGALFGLLISSWPAILSSRHPAFAIFICLVVTLFCALSAVREGDKFWYRLLRLSWQWWT
jgi:curved DNA-binding protein CbpA